MNANKTIKILEKIEKLEGQIKAAADKSESLLNTDFRQTGQTEDYYKELRKYQDLLYKKMVLLKIYCKQQETQAKAVNLNFRQLEKTNRYITSTTFERADKKQSRRIIAWLSKK